MATRICRNCRFYSISGLGVAECSNKKADYTDVVTGTFRRGNCSVARMEGRACGPRGDLYEARFTEPPEGWRLIPIEIPDAAAEAASKQITLRGQITAEQLAGFIKVLWPVVIDHAVTMKGEDHESNT